MRELPPGCEVDWDHPYWPGMATIHAHPHGACGAYLSLHGSVGLLVECRDARGLTRLADRAEGGER